MSHIGEVVESATQYVIGQTYEPNIAPAFGSYVRIKSDLDLYGLIYNVLTKSIDPNRRPAAYNLSFEELKRQQPQLSKLLKTEFEVLIIGYRSENSEFYQHLPPRPAKLHSFVYKCVDIEIESITFSLDFLRTIFVSTCCNVPVDELIAAAVREAKFTKPRLIEIGKELTYLIGNDYDRLTSILKKLDLKN